MDFQRRLGADVIMAFDECAPGGVTREQAARANRRTTAWLERCRARFEATHGDAPRPQALFPVLQGNVYDDLRAEQLEAALALGDWPGFGIGGLSVGEAKADMWRTLELNSTASCPGTVPATSWGWATRTTSWRRSCAAATCSTASRRPATPATGRRGPGTRARST